MSTSLEALFISSFGERLSEIALFRPKFLICFVQLGRVANVVGR